MLIIAFFANNGVWKYMYVRFRGKIVKLNNFLRFRAPFGIIFRAMIFKKIREVR